jgi:hypothetical protein
MKVVGPGAGWLTTGWLGLDRIMWWFLDLPLSAVPLAFGLFFLLGAYGLLSEERERLARSNRR